MLTLGATRTSAFSVICFVLLSFTICTRQAGAQCPYTPIQHGYPRSPLDTGIICRISSYFDAVRGYNNKPHHAQDVVFDDGAGGGVNPAYGTPVYAMEAGRVVVVHSGEGPATGYPACSGAPGNYVKIRSDADNYYTVYFHVTPAVSASQHVDQGQVIGHIDTSGCQNAPHVHIARKDPSNVPVNFTIPCINPLPTTRYSDGLVDDDVPDDI